MSAIVIFTLGYVLGGASALLLIGLTLAGRKDAHERHILEMNSRDAERYSL